MPVVGEVLAGGGLVVGLLGPVEIGTAGGVMAPVPQPRLRVLLGLLGVAAGRVVNAEALVDGVWGEEWSPGRERNLHALVYQLRRRLAGLEPDKGWRPATSVDSDHTRITGHRRNHDGDEVPEVRRRL